MTTATITTSAADTSAKMGFFARMKENWAQHKTYRSTLRELKDLTDRDLNDIGICRADIHDIARGTFRK